MQAAVDRERTLLELALEAPVRTLSWHNPDQSNLLEFDSDTIIGLANAYSRRLKQKYVYCSDSNGYWRFQPMPVVIAENHSRLHFLTHPEWWTPQPLPPSDRIDRAILGRARKVRRNYDLLLQRAGRLNV